MRDTWQRGPASTPNPAPPPDTGHATAESVTALADRRPTSRRRRPPCTHRWALLISARYGLTLPEARAELRRLAVNGWQTWEFHTRFNDRKDTTE